MQLCTKHARILKAMSAPTSSATDQGLLDILREGRADRRAAAVERLAQATVKRFGKLSDENKDLKRQIKGLKLAQSRLRA